MTRIKNILFCLALAIPAVPLVDSKNGFWGTQKVFPDDLAMKEYKIDSKNALRENQKVFPDDIQWLSQLKNMKLKDDSSNDVDAKKYKICQTEECKKVAEEFLSSMNKTIDPCEDFYEFACGGWKVNNPIPPSMPAWSRFMIFQTTVQYRIKHALEAEPKSSDILPVRQAKKWYHSCMNTETLERRGVKPIESILMQAGGWPIAMDEEEWVADEYTWQKVERIYTRLTGSYVFYDVQGSPTLKDTKYGEIYLKAPSIPLAAQAPLKYKNYTGEELETYTNFLEKIVHLFVQHNHADVSKERIRKEAEEIVEFEKELYELIDDSWHYDRMVYDEFLEWYNSNVTESDPEARIDWEKVIQDLFDLVNIKVHQSSSILVQDTSYIKGIGEVLQKTKPRTIVNYIHWKFVTDMLQFTSENMRDEVFGVVATEYGMKERPPRWKECVNEMKMTHAAAYTFVTKFFTKSTETPARRMVKNIQNELENLIDESNWLDEESKQLSKHKLKNMHIFIGFPDWYNNRTALLDLYKGLSIGADYFDNSLNYIRYDNKKRLKWYTMKIDRRRSDDSWYIDPITVNALYSPDDNTVNVPAVDFQSPLFTKGLPDNVNYAIAGLVVGHEMGHGFDDHGIRYSENGNETSLSESMLKSYYQRAECFLNQFGEYYGETPAPETEGTTTEYDWIFGRYGMSKAFYTRGENIADTTGMQAVYQAYQKLKKSNGEARLPGLEEFNDDQLFFLSFAAMWCEIGTPEYEEKRSKSRDSHSPPRYRVIGAVSNTKDFAKAFNCPKNSPMNPDDKCTIWEENDAVPKPPTDCDKSNNYRWGGQWRY